LSLAIFDLDNTLIAGDSDYLWGEFLIEQSIVDRKSFKQSNDAFYDDYCRGELDIVAYQRFALTPLSKFSMVELNELHNEFMRMKIYPLMLTKAQTLIEKHRLAGDTLLIITATNRFVTGPIAKALNIDTLLATEGEIVDGRYTGEPTGTPCFAEGKVTRLREWLITTNNTLDNAFFYSDSHNDLPLLKLVDNPVAVDPDPTLSDTATDAGWPIISLR